MSRFWFVKFFSSVQKKPWYRNFLNDLIEELPRGERLLDVGTGPAKLLQILSREKNMECTGIDTNELMLEEARKELDGDAVALFCVKKDKPFPFEKNSFDHVALCNVLFNLKPETCDHLLEESLRVLKPTGKLFVLTPTGRGGFWKLSKKYFSWQNLSIYIWYAATRGRARAWTEKHYLESYVKEKGLSYTTREVFDGFAILEVIYGK